ncbi:MULTISPECIES: hypothetical protein [unclassified Sphingomonas]|uniref:PAS domain-containing protein n=1 Tax=unclassified Sphingomonas TaxID=196159 RepID=UPI00092B4DC9|nr:MULTISPECIES: hypothetical protein [unclassified Sphingomonas]MBN8847415.1 hypothetical protein [Sphingomonas sp.]OJV32334.1 MAG: hypothetical protein BGO24_16310 [Sphingomonas sp. 67-36]
MDTARGFDDGRPYDSDPADGGVGEATLDIGTDERRMHVRAYNHWVSLLKGRAYPSIEDLDPAGIADFGAHSVLLDFTRGIEDPEIQFLGRALREECELDHAITRIAEVPARSLLSRLTDHYLQIIANRAPIGFEAEFVGTRGHQTLYRGILMPFSSSDDQIDYIYGVINWKEVLGSEEQARLGAELAASMREAPAPAVDAPADAPAVWADGPSRLSDAAEAAEVASVHSLGDRLALARESAAAARASDVRSRAALYRALGRAHDFALAAGGDPEGLAELLEDAGLTQQARAPMTPIVKLVFGADYDKTRLTEFAAVLGFAQREGVPMGGLVAFIDDYPAGVKGIVAAQRALRRPAKAAVAPVVKDRAPIAHVAIDTGAAAGEIVVLVARATGEGALDVLGAVANDSRLANRALAALD